MIAVRDTHRSGIFPSRNARERPEFLQSITRGERAPVPEFQHQYARIREADEVN